MPKCVFINLDSAVARRAKLEAAFAEAAPEGWTLERFAALGPGHRGLTGTIGPGAEGCFHSHREVLAAHLDDEAPLLVVEDDTVFTASTFPGLDRLMSRDNDWDILLTEATLLDPLMMLQAMRIRELLAARADVGVIDLKDKPFAGLSGYAVRGASKRKLSDALARADLSAPVDLYVRRLAKLGHIKVAVATPFLTTHMPEAYASQIGADDATWDRPVYLFRRYMHADRDLAACAREADDIYRGLDERSRAAAAVLASYLSPQRNKHRK